MGGKNYHDYNLGTQSQRIDTAWVDFQNEKLEEEQRKQALLFLIFAFDLDYPDEDSSEIVGKLTELMYEKEAHKSDNPEYIPGQTPLFLALHELVFNKRSF